jgi:hypothetical protein
MKAMRRRHPGLAKDDVQLAFNETSERQWDDVAHQPEDRRGGAIDPAILGFRTGVRTDGLKQKLTRRTSENVSPWCFLRCLVLKNSG